MRTAAAAGLLPLGLLACGGPWLRYEPSAAWLLTAAGDELAYTQVYVDPIPYRALGSPPVEVKVYLVLENETETPLHLHKESLALVDWRQSPLELARIDPGRGTEAGSAPPRTRSSFTLVFATPPATRPEPAALAGFVFRWGVEQKDAVVAGRVDIDRDWGYGDGDGSCR